MNFAAVVDQIDFARLRERLRASTTDQVRALLRQETIRDDDLPFLFSPAAGELIEEIARRAAHITVHRFGRVVNLYAPLYLSNACVNDCVYCGFAAHNRIKRATLTVDEAVAEAQALHDEGFRHILLVTGEAPRVFSVDDLITVVRRLTGRFASIAIEVFPMSLDEYRRLEQAGVDGLTLYQETYDRTVYAHCHRGPKADFDGRLNAIESGGQAGFRSLGIGTLLGLKDWREEATLLAWHGRYLARRFWRSRVAFSFPRLRPATGGFSPPHPVADADLAQMLIGLRLALPDAEIVISTREPAALRDSLVPLGVTRMSAGSRTNPGGYRDPEGAGKQFDVHDARSPAEVARAIALAGREPVWKDFDPAFLNAPTSIQGAK